MKCEGQPREIRKGDIVGTWRCLYASPFRYDFRSFSGSHETCVYQDLLDRKWRIYSSDSVIGPDEWSLFRAVSGFGNECSPDDYLQNTFSI